MLSAALSRKLLRAYKNTREKLKVNVYIIFIFFFFLARRKTIEKRENEHRLRALFEPQSLPNKTSEQS